MNIRHTLCSIAFASMPVAGLLAACGDELQPAGAAAVGKAKAAGAKDSQLMESLKRRLRSGFGEANPAVAVMAFDKAS